MNEEQKKKEELQKRVEAFNGELLPLLGKYKLALGASAMLMPNGTIGARPMLLDDPAKPETPPPTSTEITPA